jgi:hypothetical protein
MIRIFILCPTESILNQAQIDFVYDWSVPILVPQIPQKLLWLENNAWFIDLKQYDTLEYIGFLSNACAKKIDLAKLDTFLRTFKGDNEFVHFYSSPHLAIRHGNDSHAGFASCWVELCKRVPDSDVYIRNLCCNYWMCKPRILYSFIEWMKQIVMPTCLDIQGMYLPTKYKGKLSPEELQKKWGRPFYPIAPFVLERFSYQFFRKKNCLLLDFSHATVAKQRRIKIFYYFLTLALLSCLLTVNW